MLTVSKLVRVPLAVMLDQMMGVRPIWAAMALTRSSMSPYGGRKVLGVTPVTSLMTFFVHPSSATISLLDSLVR